MRSLALVFLLLTSCGLFQMTATRYDAPFPEGVLSVVPYEPNGRPDRFAVIIGLNAEDRHRGNISLAYQILIESGFNRDSIFVLDVSTHGPYFPKTDVTSALAVRELLKQLGQAVEKQDEIVVYVTGHGVLVHDEPYMLLNPSERMDPWEFLSLIDGIEPARGLLLLDQCYWDIRYKPMGCAWTTITVSKPKQETKGLVFPQAFWFAFRQGAETVNDAFVRARERDRDIAGTANRPDISYRSCGSLVDQASAIQF